MDIRQPVSSIMTRELTYVKGNTSVEDISKLFNTKKFHHLPVVDDDGAVIGMISQGDYFKLMDSMSIFETTLADVENKKMFRSLIASEIMVPKPYCFHETGSIESALHIFIENDFRALPVVDDGKIVGILTPIDIMKAILAAGINN
jgi:CBS domain-containing protein